MAGRLEFYFDEEGDMLDISVGKPRKAVTRELENDVAVRIDPETEEVVGFTILNFTRRFKAAKASHGIDLPINARIIMRKGRGGRS